MPSHAITRPAQPGTNRSSAPPAIDPSTRPLEHLAELVAQQQRNTLGFGVREPIGDLRRALDRVGVHVFVDALRSKLAGLYTFVPDFGYCILVNRLHPHERMLVRLVSTPEILQIWARAAPDRQALLPTVVRRASELARFRPHHLNPHQAWWNGLLAA